MTRKTVNFDEGVFEAIQERRGKLLMGGKEVNFTEMVNRMLKQSIKGEGK